MTPLHDKSFDARLDEHTFTWNTGYILRGFSVNKKDDKWVCVIRAFDKAGHAVYAMSTADSAQEAWAGLRAYLFSRDGGKAWRADGYYKAS